MCRPTVDRQSTDRFFGELFFTITVIREELISIWAGIHKWDSPPCDMVQLTKEYYCSYDKTKETKKISKKHEATITM